MDELANHLDGKNVKLTSTTVIEKISNWDDDDDDKFCTVDVIDIIHSLLLKQLPPERFDGVINLLYVLEGIGTVKDLENALVM